MNNHFSPKSLLFYGTMIGSVTILFRFVSAYGEANLSAPPNIGGYYLSEQTMPGCPDSTQIAITIQQSGRYLHGALNVVERSGSSQSTQDKLTLGGLWQKDTLSLEGVLPLNSICQANQSTDPNSGEQGLLIAVAGRVSNSNAEETELTGVIKISSDADIEFTAVRSASSTQPTIAH